MLEADELHWRYLKDSLDHSRHHETLRATVTNLIVVVSGAAFAVVGYDKCVTHSDRPLLIFIAILGIFGTLFAATHTERSIFFYERARRLREELDKSPANPNLVHLKVEAEARHKDAFHFLSKQQNRFYWYLLPAIISALAVVLFLNPTDITACK